MRVSASIIPLLNWKTLYASAEVTGEEDGATIVTFTSAIGVETKYYFDNESAFSCPPTLLPGLAQKTGSLPARPTANLTLAFRSSVAAWVNCVYNQLNWQPAR